LKIAFAALYDLKNLNRGSGTYFHIYKELISQNHNVEIIRPLEIVFPFLSRLFRFLTKRILNKRYRSYQDPFIGAVIGKNIESQLERLEYDFFLTNDYTIAAYIKINKPIVLWTDSIFPFNYRENRHPWIMNMSWVSVKFCQIVVRRSLRNVSLCIVPGDWNYKEILKYDILDKNQLSIIPFGANMNNPGISLHHLKKIDKTNLNILFVGKDFKLKGLDCAMEVIQILQMNGVQVTLNIVGNNKQAYQQSINKKIKNNSSVKFHGFLDKKNPDELNMLIELYKRSHVFLLPSIAEGFGISYIEAASFGIPSLGYKTHGVTTAVKNGFSGILLDINKGPNDFADTILSFIEKPKNYKNLCKGARAHYDIDGRWEIIIPRFIDFVDKKFFSINQS
tara:strand:+ start:14880 stop:16058 length:1179 start_codon:yes stop_codon:yes gene_type:complete